MDRKWVFAKMQGLGNDFIVLDLRDPRSLSSLSPRAHEIASRAGLLGEVGSAELSGLARRWCDRHFGIGADGLLLILPSTVAAARMRVLNADGSEAEMCGNGLRCVARRLHEQEGLEEVRIETGAGVLACSMVSGEEGPAVPPSSGGVGRPGLSRVCTKDRHNGNFHHNRICWRDTRRLESRRHGRSRGIGVLARDRGDGGSGRGSHVAAGAEGGRSAGIHRRVQGGSTSVTASRPGDASRVDAR